MSGWRGQSVLRLGRVGGKDVEVAKAGLGIKLRVEFWVMDEKGRGERKKMRVILG